MNMFISKVICLIENRWNLHIFPDKLYLAAEYRVSIRRKLHWRHPESFTEKIQWMKIYDRQKIYPVVTDKFQVKRYIASHVGERYVIPNLGVWQHTRDIDLSQLPNRFVLKCNHDCGSIVFCQDKQTFDWLDACHRLDRAIRRNFFWVGREWAYRLITPLVIAEPYLADENGQLPDYKFFCFHGSVKFFKIDVERFTEHRAYYFDRAGQELPFGEAAYPRKAGESIDIPNCLDQMIELAEMLASGFRFIRVDMYYIDGKIKIGELSLYPGSGFLRYDPDSWDYSIGKLLDLSGLK